MIRPIKAHAIVKKVKPQLNVRDIYSTKDIKEVKLEKGEKIVEVTIMVR
jgi:hypothetical protein